MNCVWYYKNCRSLEGKGEILEVFGTILGSFAVSPFSTTKSLQNNTLLCVLSLSLSLKSHRSHEMHIGRLLYQILIQLPKGRHWFHSLQDFLGQKTRIVKNAIISTWLSLKIGWVVQIRWWGRFV